MRKLVLLAVVGLAGAGVAILPSLGAAQATSASFVAVDNGMFFPVPTWSANGTTSTSVTIAPGGTVTFSYPSGTTVHQVVFTGPQPTSCVQDAPGPGTTIQGAPPLPYTPELAGWSGHCRFDTEGTYPFKDGFYGEAMSGTVVVTTGTTTTTTTTQTTTTSTGTTTTTFHEPSIPGASSSLRAAAVQHGTVVRGQLHVTAPGSRLIADLLLGKVLVGRITLHGVPDGTRRFAVALNRGGRNALRLRHRLALVLRTQVLLSGALGPTTLSRHVTLIG